MLYVLSSCYLTDPKDESQDSYKKAPAAFEAAFDIKLNNKQTS
jgi:hypothetical protein